MKISSMEGIQKGRTGDVMKLRKTGFEGSPPL